MKIHEYQAKDLLIAYGINAQKGFAVTSAQEAVTAAEKLNCPKYVIKAQVHSGGRGKAGGVKLASSLDEVKEITQKMLGMRLITPQTGAEGKLVSKVLVTNAIDIAKEYYLSITMDGASACPIIVVSAEGGTEIEVTAHNNPDAIITYKIPASIGFKDFQARDIAKLIKLDPKHIKAFTSMLKNMYKMFIEKDCSLVEINPLVITKQDELLAIDAKINFDDNAIFRHPDILSLRDIMEEDPKEAEAAQHDLSYVALDGSIGCMVNGAGLAMATMDIIKAYGGFPANFLDVGGSATAERVAAAFKILLSDKNVKAILVNIFGGIMKCDVIAEGIIAAAQQTGLKIPLVVRLDGTNVEKGRQILSNSGLAITPANSLADAAKLAVEKSKA